MTKDERILSLIKRAQEDSQKIGDTFMERIDKWSNWTAYIAILLALAWIMIPALIEIWTK
jgi:hypothetical protein